MGWFEPSYVAVRKALLEAGVVVDPFTLMEIVGIARQVACLGGSTESLVVYLDNYLGKAGVNADPRNLSAKILELIKKHC